MRLIRLFSLIALVLGFITMSTGNDAVAQDLENTLYLDLKDGRVVIQDRKSVV